MKKESLDGVQALRVFALLLVLGVHGTQIIHERTGYHFLDGFVWTIGYSGADIFFVISGFIIYYTSYRWVGNPAGRLPFLATRLLRIYPFYWITLLLVLLGHSFSPPGVHADQHKPLVLLGSFLLLPLKTKVIGVAWTLSYEILFYLAFAYAFFKNLRLWWAICGLWVGYYYLVPHVLGPTRYGPFSDFLAQGVVFEIIYGCAMAHVFLHWKERVRDWAGLITLVGLALLVGGWLNTYYNWVIAGREITVGIACAILVLGTAGLRLTFPAVVLTLADASFAIYLAHGTAISALTQIAIGLGVFGRVPGMVATLGIFTATIGGLYLFHRWIEVPVMRKSRILADWIKECSAAPRLAAGVKVKS